jgi:protein Tex
MDFVSVIAKQSGLATNNIDATVKLLNDDNTIPFIARYRKEKTGGLDEEQIRFIQESLDKLRTLEDRRTVILKIIEEQGKLSDDLRKQIEDASTKTELEDLYQPYKQKRRTRAGIAKERGLAPLAELIKEQSTDQAHINNILENSLNDEVPDIESALTGARDILAEMISDQTEIRAAVRAKTLKWGVLTCSLAYPERDPGKTYASYYEFTIRIDRIKPHQVLALNRGEIEKALKVGLEIPERDWRQVIQKYFRPNSVSPLANEMVEAIEDSAKRLLLPSIERDVRRILTEKAEEHAIRVFADNLRNLLMQPPISGLTVLGLDPGFRTGCKVAIVDQTGKLLQTKTIYPHEPQKHWDLSQKILIDLIRDYSVRLVAIGNGTASRETEELVAQITSINPGVKYLIVNEAGASVYSASQLARKEFPELDVSLRGAVSIARRVQDPLAELVKIDPKSIGVGMYQHDINQLALAKALDAVVESAVNSVGVDLNTASPALLTYVAGIGSKLAEKIADFRDENGKFAARVEIIKVPGLGIKAFEQAAGFVRVYGGNNPLDESAIHPESYPIAEKVLAVAGLSADTPLNERRIGIEKLQNLISYEKLAVKFDCGIQTLRDICEQLVRPGRDPREALPTPILRSDVLSMDDLHEGMLLMGTVRNVVDFGAFVDIGVKQDGLIHNSRIPRNVHLRVGDIIQVSVLIIDKDRGRISLGMPG